MWQVAPRCTPNGRPNGLLRLARRTARNLAIDELRRLRTEPMEPEELLQRVDDDPQDWRGPDPHLREHIRRCREELPGQPARALGARLENAGAHPDRTLAEELGMKLNTFLQNVTRARRLLAECLRRRGVDLDLELS